MKLEKVSLRGMTRFDDVVEVDFSDLGRIVAVVGKNGSGKTTLLEAVPAALYRRLPSRPGSLYDHAQGRDAYVEASFSGGLIARTLVDADRRQTESYLLKDGVPIVNGKAAEYAAKVDELFGSQALFLSSVFACQTKAGSFLSLAKSERKALLIELLGLEKLQTMSERARAKAKQDETRLAESRGALNKVKVLHEDIVDEEAMLLSIETDVRLSAAAVETAERELTAAREIKQRLEQIAEGLEGLRIEHKGAVIRLSNVTAAKLKMVAAHEQARAAAVRRVEDAQTSLVSAQAGNMREMERLGERMARALTLAARKDAVALAVKRVEGLREEAEASRRAGQAKVLLAQERERAGLIAHAPCSEAPDWVSGEAESRAFPLIARHVDLRGTCPLLENARQAERKLPALEVEAAVGGREVSLVLREIRETETVAGMASAVENAEVEVTAIETERRAVAEAWQERRVQCEVAITEAQLALGALPKDPPTGEPEISAAQAWLTEAARRLREAEKDAQDVQTAQHTVTNAEASIKYARERASSAVRDEIQSRARLMEMQRRVEESKALLVEIAQVEDGISEWNLLAEALGRDGVQALEIDAVGPGIAAVTNELLDACYGSRFRVEFATLREKKTGGQMESFDIKVYDHGRECLVENLSGGEKTIVSEALGLAIAVINARQSSVHWETLWRDETAGALDPEAAQAYVEMLRRAADVGGFRQVVFVSHSPEVWQRADSRVELQDGVVTLG